MRSIVWYFCYIVSQGISISLVTHLAAWYLSTGFFLFFGAGFYIFNLSEIRRKQSISNSNISPEFIKWQQNRAIELLILAGVALAGAYFIHRDPAAILLAAPASLVVAFWQLALTRDYHRRRFIAAGI